VLDDQQTIDHAERDGWHREDVEGDVSQLFQGSRTPMDAPEIMVYCRSQTWNPSLAIHPWIVGAPQTHTFPSG
jgi:hypothetical protein